MSAAASDWLPFYGDDFFESESIAGMDDSALSLYLWLLWRQWKHGALPGPNVLRRLNHRWQARWDEVWPQVAPKFGVDDDGRLSNFKLGLLRVELKARLQKAQESGRRGGFAKAAARVATATLVGSLEAACSEPLGPSPSEVPPPLPSPSPPLPLSLIPLPSLPTPSPGSASSASPQKRAALAAHQEFIDWWCLAFEAATGNAYAFEGAKDGAHVKAILGYAKGDLDLARERAVILLRGEDPYYAEKGINLATLRSQWNRLGSVRPAMTQAQRSLRGAMRASAEGRTDPLIDRFFDTTLPPERRLGGG